MLEAIGIGMSAMGAITSSIGAYYSAKSQKHELEARALDEEYQSRLADINARRGEQDAQFALAQGEQHSAFTGLEHGLAKSEYAAATGARGIQAGVGSDAEVRASMEIAKQVDRRTIWSNATRAANASRMQAQNDRNAANLGRVSAANIRASARTINPRLAATTSLLNSATAIASNWLPRSTR